jgi:hypothetical protein
LIFIPIQPRRFPNCPAHGRHEKWIWSEVVGTGKHGVNHAFSLCGLCCIDLLKQLGYTVIEPETLKEDAWILDEMPEVKK